MSLPERLGRLRRIDRIGAGGFATVWLYHDDELDSPVAVKALADNWAIREDVCDRFLEEARILRRADSDHVVRVYDIGEVNGTPYFVMSYADRGTVADLIEPGQTLHPDRVVDLLAQAGDGVSVLHRHGVIHRDIKPQNLLLRSTPDGGERVMVADLGVAKAMLHASGLTQVVGTPAYMAPEQAVGIGLDLRADVHALGAVGYHLMTGRFVREGSIGSLAFPTLPPAPSRISSVPQPYDAVLLRAIATSPEDRWPDVPSFVNALRMAQQSADPPAPETVHVGAPLFAPLASPVTSPVPPAPPASASPVPPIPVVPAAQVADHRTAPRPKKAAPPTGGRLKLAALALLVLLVAFGASYGAVLLLGGDDPQGKDPAGQGESPTENPAADIDFPALVLPTDFAVRVVRTGERVWGYPVPTGWVPYRAADTTGDGVIPDDKVDKQSQIRWRPQGEPPVGGYSLRVQALASTETVPQKVVAKVKALKESPDLVDVDVYKQTDDTIYFTYRDDSNRVRYNFFRWVQGESGQAEVEISVSGRKADEPALSALLDKVSSETAPSAS